ncbi:hypothetical protein IAD21_01447 [Abditibacteriota bacterium]|nr:hypothetical protein IAD21_01447 [Abditibacteriota bacterium]
MFKAKHSDLVITQYEHLKLSGALALHWGNTEFELSPCHFESFVKGIALHYRGYGFFDTLAIGEVSEDEWLDVSRKSFFGECDEKVADLVIKHHILRLVARSNRYSPQVQTLLQQMNDSISGSVRAAHLDEKLFAFIDRITDLCDKISFDFCFQNYGTGVVEVQRRFADADSVQVKYTIEAGNTIKISPWPLSVAQYRGYIVAYNSMGFPEKLEPQILDYSIIPA